jgi:hypothetical protein
MNQRFIPKLEAKKVPYKVEITHFSTDADSIGEVCPCTPCANIA